MNSKHGKYAAILGLLIILASCEKIAFNPPTSSKQAVFEYAWTSIDEKYAFFELKNIDWDSVYLVYKPQISESMSDEAFFDILSQMIAVLRDGHSGLNSFTNAYKNVVFFINSPENFDYRLITDHYFGGWGNYTAAFQHTAIKNGRIAYIYYESFSSSFNHSDVAYLIDLYSGCDGMIIDVRNNFGGAVDNVYKLASHFTNENKDVFGSVMKSGSGHNDFSSLVISELKPEEPYWNKPVCVLTNRKTYSAGSVFTLVMKELNNVTVIGDTTGGGLGLPIGTELPNGWQIHYAGSQILSVSGVCYELGIPPHVQIHCTREDADNGLDSIIEKACEIMLQ